MKELSGQTGRLLQTESAQLITNIEVNRYDPYENGEIESIELFSGVFSVFAWLGLIAIVLSVLTGFGVVF